MSADETDVRYGIDERSEQLLDAIAHQINGSIQLSADQLQNFFALDHVALRRT